MTSVTGTTGAQETPASTGARVDPVLLRLPAAAWHALASLGATGIAVLLSWALGAASLGPASPLMPLIIVAAGAAPAAWALGALSDRLFDRASVRYRRRFAAVILGAGAPAVLLSWTMLVTDIAKTTASPAAAVLALAGVLASVVVALVAVVLVPVAAERGDAGPRTLLIVASVAALRRPFAPLGALAVTGTVAWFGLTWFGGLLLLAPPLLVVLSVAAAWPTASAIGVSLPRLTSVRRPSRGES